MKKSEIKKLENNELIREYVFRYSVLSVNINLQMATKMLAKQCADLETELVNRGLLTAHDVEVLNG